MPFDFERRCVSLLADNGTERLLVHKGAFEDVLRHSTRYEAGGPGSLKPLDDAARGRVVELFQSLSLEGFRVLGIAWKQTARDHVRAVVDDESELVFAGFAAFEDPPKASAAAAVGALAGSGVTVKIVTGDNELVTQHVCAELGLPVTGVLTGEQIQAMTDPALAARAESVNLFCRVTPPPHRSRCQAAAWAREWRVGKTARPAVWNVRIVAAVAKSIPGLRCVAM